MDEKDTLQKITKNDGKQLAYRLRQGRADLPLLVFLGGYRSDMMGSKATFLDGFCAEHGYGLLRFDYSGHGASDGDFRDGCIGDWLDDAVTVIGQLGQGDMVLIGSSMGGWIGLLVAQAMAARVKGFIGIAAAPDFTDWVWNHHMTPAQQNLCRSQGYIDTPDGDVLTLKLFEDGAQHLVMDKPLVLPFPVTLLQGRMDTDVPVSVAQKLAAHITPNPAKLMIIDDGDHRLAREQDLSILGNEVRLQMGSS